MKRSLILFFVCCFVVHVHAMEQSNLDEQQLEQQWSKKSRSFSMSDLIGREYFLALSPEEKRKFLSKSKQPKHNNLVKKEEPNKAPVSKTRSVSDQTVPLVVNKLRKTLSTLPPEHEISPKNPSKKTAEQ